MNAEQKKLFETIVSGPRAQNYGSDAAGHVLRSGPFNAWMRSPEVGMRLQAVGEHIRFKSSIPKHLNELAILVTAREWTSQYEWFAHHALAMKAGLDPKIADAIAAGKRPESMKDDEAAIYEFCTQLHRNKKVDDATFNKVKALFGEQGVIDLVAVSGYYVAVSMTLNVARSAGAGRQRAAQADELRSFSAHARESGHPALKGWVPAFAGTSGFKPPSPTPGCRGTRRRHTARSRRRR